MQWVVRFLVGGVLISAFATLGDVLKPRGFAGLFGAAPSVALATLTLTLVSQGKGYAAIEARSMIFGALAFVVYAIVCVYLMGIKRTKVSLSAVGALSIWAAIAWGLWALFLR